MMEKRVLNIIFLLFFALGLGGCSDYLDEKPNSTFGVDEFYTSSEEVDMALAGMYAIWASDAVFGRNMIIMDSGTDESYYNRRSNANWTVGLYRETPSDNYVRAFWKGLYEVINLSNLLEEKLDKEAFSEEDYDRYIGESRFIRGFSYFLLTSWFNEVPLRLVPTKDQSSNDKAPAPLPEVYAQIVSDLTFASEHLPSKGDSGFTPGRPDDMAAHGLLARVYLKMAGNPLDDEDKYKDAKKEAQIVIEDGTHGLNTEAGNGYRNHFLSYIQNEYDLKESLFEISFKYLRGMGLTVDGRIGNLNGLAFAYGGGRKGYPGAYAQLSPSPVLKTIYEDGDMRKDWNVPGIHFTSKGKIKSTGVFNVAYTPGTYRRWEPVDFDEVDKDVPDDEVQNYEVLEDNNNLNKNFTSINFPILRYSDVLLMYAEASNAINGPSSDAINSVDQVRNRAGLDNLEDAKPTAVSSREAFFNELVDERMRELPFEGLRKMDLIRWGLLGKRLDFLADIIKGDPDYSSNNAMAQAFLRPSEFFDPSKDLSLPYPLQEVKLNDSLEQKDNW